ncbi:hypothetical protein RD792_012667 [Penstemon davidsonii]|uniref:Protein SMG7 n=1 Tax=Penstemon davidsonii TaxID=160366 RepID=A0ABR0CXH8_9LAMI|nr:hypothetical protein RD792_012667 [Penstemon davidsonii]
MMTIPMDNSKEDSRQERVQRLFNKNLELENKRRKAAQARVPSDPNIWQQMRENYEAIVLEDHTFSEKHDIEYALWQLHYRRIEELRALFNASIASAGSTAPQNGKGPVRSGPDRLTKIRSQFKTFLSEATGFYHDFMLKIRAKYGLQLGYFSVDQDNQISSSKDGDKSSEVKKGLISCHRCLIYLGDLARYKGLYGEGDSKSRDFTAASSYYMQASSLWPSSGNSHHQLAILAGYLNEEMVSVYRYFRSLAIGNPFVTARDNLIIAFEKVDCRPTSCRRASHTFDLEGNLCVGCVLAVVLENRQNYTQLFGDARVTAVKSAPSKMATKGRGKGEAKSSFKDNKVETGSVTERSSNKFEPFKAFITRFIRLNGILFTRTSLETFDEVFSMVKNDLLGLLSSGPDEECTFGSDNNECRLAVVRMIAILIFTVHNVNKENENQSYADILQRSVLLKNAFTATFELMSSILERCNQLSDPSSSYLLPGIMVFVEWLACHHDVAVGTELEEKQVNARSFFWNNCISLLNKLLTNKYGFFNDDEDETCFSNMSKYDESETANRLALPEDAELRGFIPLLPAQIILDFSKKHSFGGDGGNKEKIARVQRIIAAGKALADIVRIDQEGVYFDQKSKKFVIGVEPQISDDFLLESPLEPHLSGGSLEISVGRHLSVGAVPKPEVGMESEDEDEVIVFKPSTNDNKHMDVVSSKLSSSEVLASVGGFGKTDFGNDNGSTVGHNSFLLQSALAASMRPSTTVANGTPQYLPPVQATTSKWPVEHASIVNGLSHLNLTENGHSLKPELHDQFGVSQPAALSVAFPQFISAGAGHNHIAQAVVPSKFDSFMHSGPAAGNRAIIPSAIMPSVLKKNPVSRPVRHIGPPPGFGSVPSKVVDESLSHMALRNEHPLTPQIDDYGWLDGHNFSSLNQSVCFSNSINHVGPSSHSVSKSNGRMGILGFPFPGKQISTLQGENENQKGWEDYQFSEHMKLYEQHQQFQVGNQQPVGPPQQYQGQSLLEGRYRV